MVNSGDEICLEIDRVSNTGNLIAKYGVKHVHIDSAENDLEPGDLVEVEVNSVGSKSLGTRVLRVIDPDQIDEQTQNRLSLSREFTHQARQKKANKNLNAARNESKRRKEATRKLDSLAPDAELVDSSSIDTNVTREEDEESESEERNMNDLLGGKL